VVVLYKRTVHVWDPGCIPPSPLCLNCTTILSIVDPAGTDPLVNVHVYWEVILATVLPYVPSRLSANAAATVDIPLPTIVTLETKLSPSGVNVVDPVIGPVEDFVGDGVTVVVTDGVTVEVTDGVIVLVTVLDGVWVGDSVGVLDGVTVLVAVLDGVWVWDSVGVLDGVTVLVAVLDGVWVGDSVGVLDGVTVLVAVLDGVWVGVLDGVTVFVAVCVGLTVGVGVGHGTDVSHWVQPVYSLIAYGYPGAGAPALAVISWHVPL
jgi:hypothetical protein